MVIVAGSSSLDALAARASAELRAMGFVVHRNRDPIAPTFAGLERAAQQAGAAAVLRLERDARGVAICTWDRATRKLVVREWVSPAGDDGELALRAVEVLRASLLEAAAPPARTPVAALSAPERATLDPPRPAPPTPEVSLGAGLSAEVSPGGLSPMVRASINAGVAFRLGFLGRIEASLPLLEARIERAEGAAALRATAGGLWLGWRVTPPRWRIELAPIAGVSVLFVDVVGAAAAGYESRRSTAWTAAPWGGARVAVRASDAVRITLDARAGATVPTQRVFFVDRLVASWGAPWLSMAIGVEVNIR